MAACRAFDVGPTMRAPTFADEKESDTVVLFVLDEGSDNFVRDLYDNRWRLALKFIPSRPKPVYTPGAPGFAEDTNRPRQPPIVEDLSPKYSQPSGATDRKKGKKGKKVDKKGKKHTNVKNAKKGKKNMNVKKHMKGKKAKKQINGKKDKKQRSVIH